jgi:hemolysin III
MKLEETCKSAGGAVVHAEDKDEVHPTSGYTALEETMNSLTHGVGLIWAVSALTLCVVFSSLYSNAWIITTSAIYGASLTLLYLSSYLYHSARNLRWKRRFLTWDHASIYILIAGTYTPLMLGPIRGPVGWTIFGIVWCLAIGGVIREIFASKRGGVLSSIVYLAMGWICIFAIVPLYFKMSAAGFTLLIVGGGVYSLGVFFYLYRKMKYHHAIWHLFVLGGSVCQWVSILTIIFCTSK